jgi:hypothetical protein
MAVEPLILENDRLCVRVDAERGGVIASLVHRVLGASVLGTCPWEVAPGPCAGPAVDEAAWLAHYDGGWPVLFPNGGDACTFEGVAHGFHGEASIMAWMVEESDDTIVLSCSFVTAPVTMRRRIALEDDVLIVSEAVTMTGTAPARVMWTHHPTFGGDLLDGPFAIDTGARRMLVDDDYDPAANPLLPGAQADWPMVPGKQGAFDLSRPHGTMASLVYLQDLASPWVAVRRLDGAVGAALSWEAELFPCAWLWFELAGSQEPPWCGRARLLGVEPSTSWPGTGLADIARRGGPLLTLAPGTVRETVLRLHVFQPSGPVRAVDATGRAICDRETP